MNRESPHFSPLFEGLNNQYPAKEIGVSPKVLAS